MDKRSRRMILVGTTFILTAIVLGSMGAHSLKQSLAPKMLDTFETGVRYQMYHGLGMLSLGIFQTLFPVKMCRAFFIMILSTLLFSFNCYLYALTSQDIFAHLVPIGGVGLIIAWFMVIGQFRRAND